MNILLPKNRLSIKTYFKNETETVRQDVDPKQLKAGKLYFTVTKTGEIENIHLDHSSNYPKVDRQLIKLLKDLNNYFVYSIYERLRKKSK